VAQQRVHGVVRRCPADRLAHAEQRGVVLRQLWPYALLDPVVDHGTRGHAPLDAATLETVHVTAAKEGLAIRLRSRYKKSHTHKASTGNSRPTL